MGAHAWLLIFNILTESLICLKFAENEFHTTAPMIVKVGWSVALAILFIIFPLWRFVINPVKKIEGEQIIKKSD